MCLLRVCSAVRTRAGGQITVRLKGHSRRNCHCQLVRELARGETYLAPYRDRACNSTRVEGTFLFHHQIGQFFRCDAA
jgi:hypothetical protein